MNLSWFFIKFIVSTFVSSVIIVLLMFIKKAFAKLLNANGQYYLWIPVFLMLLLPFLPIGKGVYVWMDRYAISSTGHETYIINNVVQATGTDTSWLQDFSISVERVAPSSFTSIFGYIWLAGFIIYTGLLLVSSFRIYKIAKNATRITDDQWRAAFNICKTDTDLRSNINLLHSKYIKTPISVGIFNSTIIIPTDAINALNTNEQRYILMHELHHFKRKDVLINHLMCIIQAIYWFNPIIRYAFDMMRIDREIACDMSVVGSLSVDSCADYGLTILKFAGINNHRTLAVTSGFGGTQSHVSRRIERIVSHSHTRKTSKISNIINMLMFMLVFMLVAAQVPLMSALAHDTDRYTFNESNVAYEDLSDYFDGYEGCFVLYDTSADRYLIYNKDNAVTRVSPNSTYKLYSTLIGLQEGIITEANSTLTWDGIQYPYDSWNSDHDLQSALRDSVNWYFQTMDNEIGYERLKAYIKQIGYGNEDISGGVKAFWLESTLKISAVEQVMQLQKLQANDTNFLPEHVDTLKRAMRLSNDYDAELYGKTGTGTVNGSNVNGWFVGFVDAEQGDYVFATHINATSNATGSEAARITLSLLADKGILK